MHNDAIKVFQKKKKAVLEALINYQLDDESLREDLRQTTMPRKQSEELLDTIVSNAHRRNIRQPAARQPGTDPGNVQVDTCVARKARLQSTRNRFICVYPKRFPWSPFFNKTLKTRISILPLKSDKDKISQWIGFIVDINAQKQIDQTLKHNRELTEIQQQLYLNQAELQQKVVELNHSNYKLEQFAHLAPHDLQEQLRNLFFYTDVLKKRYAGSIADAGLGMINSMTFAASRMKEPINDLLSYSQLHKQHLYFEHVLLNDSLKGVIKDLDFTSKKKNAVIAMDNLPLVNGNTLRLRRFLSNLLSNALKYSRKEGTPLIQISASTGNGNNTIVVKTSASALMNSTAKKYSGCLKGLHTRDKFPGAGIGLSICKKIVELHSGNIKAHGRLTE